MKIYIFVLIMILSSALIPRTASDRQNKPEPNYQNESGTIKLEGEIIVPRAAGGKVKAIDTPLTEIDYVKAMYNKGNYEKTRDMLKVLKNDDDRKISEEAHYLYLKWFCRTFFKKLENSDKKNSYECNITELNNFLEKYPGSTYLKNELKKCMFDELAAFNRDANLKSNLDILTFSDSTKFTLENDSTYKCVFNRRFSSPDMKNAVLTIEIKGKLSTYDPWGNMSDEAGNCGLVIGDNSLITVKINGTPVMFYDRNIVHKQYPEYDLKKVIEFGVEKDKTFVRPDYVNAETEMAGYLTDDILLKDLQLTFSYGYMDRLVPQDVPYRERLNTRSIGDRFDPKVYLSMNVQKKGSE